MRSTMGSESVVTGYVQLYSAVNLEELVRVEEAELHTPLIWLHLRIYWDSVQVMLRNFFGGTPARARQIHSIAQLCAHAVSKSADTL